MIDNIRSNLNFKGGSMNRDIQYSVQSGEDMQCCRVHLQERATIGL